MVHDQFVVAVRALLAEAAGMDGVVASPREVDIVRSVVNTPGFIVVTPGVRPAGAALGDQSRVTTPREAIAGGADYLVDFNTPMIGRHTSSPQPSPKGGFASQLFIPN